MLNKDIIEAFKIDPFKAYLVDRLDEFTDTYNMLENEKDKEYIRGKIDILKEVRDEYENSKL